MRILAVADERVPQLYDEFDVNRFPKIDLIIGCGDLDPAYRAYLMGAFLAPMYYVRGNHDTGRDENVGGEDIDCKIVKYKGISIAGFGGSMWYGGGPLQYTEWQMKWRVWKLYPRLWLNSGVDIVIAHAPVKGCQDGPDVCHRGFAVFRDLIKRFRPKYFLHGHVHMNYRRGLKRVQRLEDTWVINCSGYYMFDYEEGPSERDRGDQYRHC
ncbi:MAG: metallophosphoesterase [Bacillota bacterium]|nr:metallophosphoesterase [Bacillota bacterium]